MTKTKVTFDDMSLWRDLEQTSSDETLFNNATNLEMKSKKYSHKK